MNERASHLVNCIIKNDLCELKNEKNIIKNECIYSFPNSSNEKQNWLPYKNLSLLHIAAVYDSLECFQFLYEECGIELRQKSADSFFPLHYACLYGSQEVALYILEKDPQQAAMTPGDVNYHFIFLAVLGRDTEILNALFENGADIKKKQSSDDYDLLTLAANINSIECLKILMQYQFITSDGISPLMNSIKNYRSEIALLLLNNPEQLKETWGGETIFYYACQVGKKFKEVVLKMLRINNCQCIEPKESTKKGVVHWLCQMGDVDVAREFLRTPNVDVNRLDPYGNPGPFLMVDKMDASDEEVIQILQLLIDHGFDINIRKPFQKGINAPTTYTLLEKYVRGIKISIPIIEFLIERGADIYAICEGTVDETLYNFVEKHRFSFSKNKAIKKIFHDKHEQLQNNDALSST